MKTWFLFLFTHRRKDTTRLIFLIFKFYLLPYLTVRETLIFIAKLKMSKDQNIISKRNEIVNQVIMDLGLKELADSLIGENEWKRGLSGGN
jgi:ABC-type multidrug transport system ATPase subunit